MAFEFPKPTILSLFLLHLTILALIIMEESSKIKPELWVDSYGDMLYSYCISRVLDQKIAEDLVQETFLAALKSLDRFKGESSEKTWLFAILKNKIIDHFRKKQRNREEQINFSHPFAESGMFVGHWEKERGPSAWSDDMKDVLESEDFKRIFAFCLSLLPPKLASVFSLKVVEELESDEVCKEVGITASNLWVIMHRARLQMRECMEAKWLNQ